MTRRPFLLLSFGLLSLPALAAYPGGWAVITLDDLPDHVVAGQPVTLAFTVRQHGRTPLSGLHPTIEARTGALKATATVNPEKGAGRYTASLTLPRAGEWTISINSGFMNSSVTLLPLAAIEAGTQASPPLPDAERGRRLYVAKGCVTCHLDIAVGPNLTGRQYPADYLTQFLADPSIKAPPPGGTFGMPNLSLKQTEIAALTAFINTASTAASQALR